MFNIEDAIIKLLSDPKTEFYAHLLMQVKISSSDKVPTAGVGVTSGQVNMYINPKFWESLNLSSQCHIITHEMAHIILGHLYDRGNQYNKDDRMLANIAMDAAIHEILFELKSAKQLKDMVVTVERLRKELNNPDIKNHETSEYYFNFLKQASDDLKEKIKEALKTLDEHGFNDGETEIDSDLGKSLTSALLENAIRKTKEGAGTVPNQAEITLNNLCKSKVNWRAILRRFVGNNSDVDKRLTRSRRNRRNDDINIPGKRKKFNPHVVVCVDTSGSMCGDPLEQVAAELFQLQKLGYEIEVVEADCAVSKHYKFDKRKFKNFTGGGGTAYIPSIEFAKKLGPDVILYLGDMDSSDIPQDPGIPFCWIVVGTQKPPADFGKVVYVE